MEKEAKKKEAEKKVVAEKNAGRYRAVDIENGKFIYGFYLVKKKEKFIYGFGLSREDDSFFEIKDHPEVLLNEYLGRVDRKGDKIYEDDIILLHGDNDQNVMVMNSYTNISRIKEVPPYKILIVGNMQGYSRGEK